MDKLFFWRDKSGRGFASPFSEPDLKEAFNDDDESWDGETISQWVETAEVGDKWENAANEVTRTK
jgi:hypothetical protein